MALLLSHLTECMVIENTGVDQHTTEINLKCACGSGLFILLHPVSPDLRSTTQTFAVAEPPEENDFFSVKAQCVRCAKEYRILAPGFQQQQVRALQVADFVRLSRKEHSPWHCSSCGGVEHSVTTGIVIHDSDDGCCEGDDLDAASEAKLETCRWLTIFTKCSRCGKETGRWISLESSIWG